ncbi:MAG: CpsD/CapB family tyrosine-protein kinase [Acidobacteria bacterium]|nr:CpsD/CapB family tyrosine-protein kinase [Acidobacteriota bacterium]
MSEIFDFLKRTEAEQQKKIPVQKPVPEVQIDAPVNSPAFASEEKPVSQPSIPIEAELVKADKFDLTVASMQVKSALDPLTLIGEQFRLLRSRLGLMQKQRGIKTVLVTSTVPEEGKTFTSSGMAGVFAQEPGKRIVLIDADMRKAKSGLNFGLNGTSTGIGLSNVLRGEIEFRNALVMSMNPEFYFLPSGPLPPNPSELLSSPNLERALKTAADDFDWVIIDSPPILTLSDTTLISPLCDAVVLVLRANSTPSKLIENSIDRIGKDKICGVVINRQKKIHSSRYYYQYYYRSSKPSKE